MFSRLCCKMILKLRLLDFCLSNFIFHIFEKHFARVVFSTVRKTPTRSTYLLVFHKCTCSCNKLFCCMKQKVTSQEYKKATEKYWSMSVSCEADNDKWIQLIRSKFSQYAHKQGLHLVCLHNQSCVYK